MCAVCVFSVCAAFSRAAVSEVIICASGSVVLTDGTICVAAGSWLEEVTADAVTSGWMVERSTSSSSVTTALAIGSAAIGSDAGTCSGAVLDAGAAVSGRIFSCAGCSEADGCTTVGVSAGADGCSGWFWSGRFFRNFRCRWLFRKRWLRVSCRCFRDCGTVNKRSHRRRRIRNHNGTAIGNGLSINIEGNLIHIQCVARFRNHRYGERSVYFLDRFAVLIQDIGTIIGKI